jgi:hypothetical protein
MKRYRLAIIPVLLTVLCRVMLLGQLVGGSAYPINGTESPPASFASIGTAVAYLTTNGATGSGQVILELSTGYAGESGPVSIGPISGTSATLGVVFRPASGYTALTSVIGQASPNQYALALNGCQYVTFDGRASGSGSSRDWTIRCTGTNGQSAIRFLNTPGSTSNNAVRYCNLSAEAAGSTSAIVALTTGTNGNQYQSNVIEYNLIESGSGGLRDYAVSCGWSTPGTANTGNVLRGNTIRRFNSTGVRITGTFPGLSIADNDIGFDVEQPTSTSLSGIFFNTTSSNTDGGVRISRNRIFNLAPSTASVTVRGFYQYSNSFTGDPVVFDNNFISLGERVSSNPTIYGIEVYTSASGTPTEIYYNSVFIGGTTSAGNSMAFRRTVTDMGLDVRNNAFHNARSGGGGTHWAIGLNSPTAGTLDFNDHYASGTGGVLGTTDNTTGGNQYTLTAWQSMTGKDLNSVSCDPNFVSPGLTPPDLHIASTSCLRGAGTPLPGTTMDIDGDTRSVTTPDIGADEYSPGSEPMSIAGKVYYDANSNGVLDPEEGGISRWPVTVDIAGRTTRTDLLGDYVFSGLPQANYRVCATAFPGYGLTATTSPCVQLSAAPGGFVVNFGFSPQCLSNIIRNGGFHGGLEEWSPAYGSPQYMPADGCDDSGYVRLYGNRRGGSAIYQQLSSPHITAGRVYELKLCMRLAPGSPVSHARIRAVAFNGAPGSGGDIHPPPWRDRAIIDVSGTASCDQWNTFVMHRWRANRDFERLAINIESNDSLSLSLVDIDNICFTEVGDTIPCYAADLDSLGSPVLPFGEADPQCPPVEDYEDRYMGRVSDLYALCGAEDGTDTWYENCPDSCVSLGGELPEELTNFFLNDSIGHYFGEIGLDSAEFFGKLLGVEDTLEGKAGNILDTLFSLGACPSLCDTVPPKGDPPDPSSPFQGRDIVFVHGYRLDPLGERIDGNPLAMTTWPKDKEEFLMQTGYWKAGANSYWRDHVRTYLGVEPEGGRVSGGPVTQNRFLIVSHAATQSGIIAVHAILWQIAEARRSGRGVILCNPTDTRGTSDFGKDGFVIISHSAGSLFSNVAMSIAGLAAKKPSLGLFLGDIGDISKRVDLHIALQGAFAGSGVAPMLLMAAAIPGLRNIAKDILGSENPPALGDLPWLYTSQTLDMSIPYFLYGGPLFRKLCATVPLTCEFADCNLIEDVPMKVITVGGGHPSSFGKPNPDPANPGPNDMLFSILAKHLFHPGFDDGVLTEDCQSGSNDRRLNHPNRYYPLPGLLTLTAFLGGGPWGEYDPRLLLNERIYDMGIHRRLDANHGAQRAIRFYLDQKLDILVSKIKNDIACALGFDSLCVHPPVVPPPPFGFELLWASSGSVPSLSPTGMVQPVLIPLVPNKPSYDVTKRFEHHFSFLQSTADHFGANYLHNPHDDQYPSYTKTGDIVNAEEVRVVSSSTLYHNNASLHGPIVSAEMKDLPREYIRGKFIGGQRVRIFGHTITLPKLWIWKRKYHLLPGGCGDENWSPDCDGKHYLDYVYQYVLRPN